LTSLWRGEIAQHWAVETIRRLPGQRVCFNSDPVPKMKTHSGAKKRFKKTASGKLRGRRAYSSHILEKKSPKRKRRMARPVEISPSDAPTVRKLLGGGK
jgi:large subunit ribosomal protein L35